MSHGGHAVHGLLAAVVDLADPAVDGKGVFLGDSWLQGEATGRLRGAGRTFSLTFTRTT